MQLQKPVLAWVITKSFRMNVDIHSSLFLYTNFGIIYNNHAHYT